MTGLKPVVRIVLVIGVEPITQTLGCPGFDKAERSSQPRLVALPIVPNYLSEPASPFRQIVRRYLPERLGGVPLILSKNGQLNILQTVVQIDHVSQCASAGLFRPTEKRIMVKPHGLLVPVSLTPRDASTPGLSTWSSTRSLQRSCDLGDLILWRVSRLDAFSISPIRT